MARDDKGLEAALWAVREGGKRFDDVAREHRGFFLSIAITIGRRWRQPGWVATEDTMQDVMLWAWVAIYRFEPGHPAAPSLTGYVFYNAFDKAKKEAHKLRKAKRSGNKADSNPSNFERPASALWGDDADRIADQRCAVEAEQEGRSERSRVLERVLACCARSDEERRLVVAAEQGGLLEDALLGDPHALAGVARALYGDAAASEHLESVIDASAAVAERVSFEFGVAA